MNTVEQKVGKAVQGIFGNDWQLDGFGIDTLCPYS